MFLFGALALFSFNCFATVPQPGSIYAIGHIKKEGLFSCIFGVLNELTICEAKNNIPVVYWSDNSYYYEPDGFNGSTNVWEYYFEPISDEIYHPDLSLHIPKSPQHFFFRKLEQKTRDHAYQLISKYIRVKPCVQEKIDDFYQQYMLDKKTIGIHLRGTDRGTYKKNRGLLNEIAKKALQIADPDTQFLVASDEQYLLEKVTELLDPYPVIFYPCYRSLNGKGLHNGKREDEQAPCRAQLGEDVLVEGILLSKCTTLLHTLSSVSTGALYFNPNLKSVLFQQKKN